MNRIAKEIGMVRTWYANPHGLMNKLNKSCSNDLCRLANAAMKNEYFSDIV
jgi:D-alanyl-D-alanine carboxypeptidase